MKSSTFLILTCLLIFACSDATKDEKNNIAISDKSEERTVGYNEYRNAYFGDVHIHTSWSFDAFIYNVRTTPDDAYRYAKGEPISHVSGEKIQIKRPLDFLAVSDHSEYMGTMLQLNDENNPLYNLEIAKRIRSQDRKISVKAFGEIGNGIATNTPDKDLILPDILKSTWQKAIEAANNHYIPGEFTTFPAYEWTSSPAVYDADPPYARNMHRNVIFKGDKVSDLPFSSFDSQNPENLWKWMDLQRAKGIELIAIPHNGNMSDGKMYDSKTYDGNIIDFEYTQTRMRNEPVNEVIQIKGQSMAHPSLSPNDEFADFEVYQHTLGRGDPRKQSQPEGSFVRKALKDGLTIEKEIGGNPFQFGFIGSTDCHNGASNHEEDNNIGKSGLQDPTPEVRMNKSPSSIRKMQTSVSGLAGVWAKQNTRAAIFESFQNKEVFATSGTRIKVRFFGGWGLDDFESENWLDTAYENGVTMGSELTKKDQSGNSPSFLIWAVKDAQGANLDRVQVVKGWVDKEGNPQEKIYDVVWSNDRIMDKDGNLPQVGNSVNISESTYTNDIGATTLKRKWVDPDFNKSESCFYYLRVLEIPTPRWSTYDAVVLGIAPPEGVPATIQERAWSSPIWYKP